MGMQELYDVTNVYSIKPTSYFTPNKKYAMKKTYVLLVVMLLFKGQSFAQLWNELGSGANALKANFEILSVVGDVAGNVYAVGQFTDGATFSDGHQYVAMWNGTTWSKVGTGINALDTFCGLEALYPDEVGNMYVAGIIDTTGTWEVAKWNGTTWSQVGTGSNALKANNGINAMRRDGGNLYVGGDFTDGSGNTYIAKWDGTTWTELGSGFNGTIRSIATDPSGNVYAIGDFTDGSIPGLHYVAKWNGTTWSQLGSGNINIVHHVASDPSGNIYLATYGDVEKWNGSSWTVIGTLGDVNVVISDAHGTIYAAGNFEDANGKKCVMSWDGSFWNEVGISSNAINANGKILTMCIDVNGNMYAAGQFKNSLGYYYVAKRAAPSGVKNLNGSTLNDLHVYPNPANSLVTFSYSMPNAGALRIVISNVLGEKVAELNGNNTLGDLYWNTDLAPRGVYMYAATVNDKIVRIGKLIVQ